MTPLTSTAWVVHDLALAGTVGGALFGKVALDPSARQIADPHERDRLVDDAWSRFNILNLIGHGIVLGTWLTGRKMLSGREVSARARRWSLVKDAFVATAAATGVASFVIGRVLGRRIQERDESPSVDHAAGRETAPARVLERAVTLTGMVNLVANVGTLAVTTLLAMEAGKSPRWSWVSRVLP